MHMLDKIQHMHDIGKDRPDHSGLFDVATEQLGYFTAAQAHAAGFGRDMLSYHTQNGRFLRLRHGLYRFRDYPSSPLEEMMEAWLAVGKDVAVVSHESALELLGLSNIIPNIIHITVPRSKRYIRRMPGIRIHTTTSPLSDRDVTVRDGMRLTNATRTILDAAEAGTAPEQIEMAVGQAIERGLTTRSRLERATEEYSRRVNRLVYQAIDRIAL